MNEPNDHELGFAWFVDRRFRHRYLYLLKKSRLDMLHKLPHFRHLDRRYATRVHVLPSQVSEFSSELKSRGAPDSCYLISMDGELDGMTMPLEEALDRVIRGGETTVVSCIPERLCYFHDEERANRFVLSRNQN